MRITPWFLLPLLAAGCAAAKLSFAPAPDSSGRAQLKDLGVAPELAGDVWINAGAPLRLAELRGKVVALEMWTFGCINCQHVVPSLRDWHRAYAGEGLLIIANHFPEFSYEADLDNLTEAVGRLDIHYPVVQDNEAANWRAYGNQYWPTLYLIDKQGHIRYIHIGEGAYEDTEAAIQALLAEPYP
jgi:thiol-disulfide isomerase/thioredoxin